MASPALELRAVEKDYGDGLGLRPTTLELGAGELALVVGPNGAGKSTMLGLCAGLLEPTSGEVLVSGEPVGSPEARAATSVIPDLPALYDDLSVWEHAEYVGRLYEVDDWEAEGGLLLDRLALRERWNDLPSKFSRGLRQKTSLLLGFIRAADLYLIDEPFVGLDAPGQATLVQILTELVEDGATVLVSTHQLDLADVAGTCIGLRDGEVVHHGRAGRDTVLRLTAG